MQMSTTWQNSGPFLYSAKYGITPCTTTHAAEGMHTAAFGGLSPFRWDCRAFALSVGLPGFSPSGGTAGL
jgi:hypothetical protein